VTAGRVPGFFVTGEPVLSGSRGQDEWQDAIRACLTADVVQPMLTFIVSSLKRRGQLFDLDNLVHPVLMVLDDPIDSVSARIYIGDRPGLLIEDDRFEPRPDGYLESVYVSEHSRGSDANRAEISEIADDSVYDEHEGVGISLVFDASEIPIRKGWFGPTEAVIDDLVPWLGTYTSRGLIADHRIRDLRISRGANPDADGVEITIWYVTDDEVRVPETLRTMIADVVDTQSRQSPLCEGGH